MLAINDHSVGTFSGGYGLTLSLNVQKYDRVVFFMAYNPGTAGFSAPVFTDITGSGTPLTFITYGGNNGIRTTNNGILISRNGLSAINTNPSGSRTIQATIPSLGPYNGVAIALSVSGTNLDDATSRDGVTYANSVNSTFTATVLAPTKTDRALGLACFMQASDLITSPRISGPDSGFNLLAESSIADSPTDFGVSLVIGTKVITTSPINYVQTTFGSSEYSQGVGITLGGPLEYLVSHNSDSNLNSTLTRNHDSDSYITRLGIINHDTDALLNAIFNRQHLSDSLLNAEQSTYHASDSALWATYIREHGTDAFINFTRAPDVKKLLVNNVPTGKNLGSQDVRVLSVNGNTKVNSAFNYERDPQEYIVGSEKANQLSIIDPIIKKKL